VLTQGEVTIFFANRHCKQSRSRLARSMRNAVRANLGFVLLVVCLLDDIYYYYFFARYISSTGKNNPYVLYPNNIQINETTIITDGMLA
jgi:hypothetical protein